MFYKCCVLTESCEKSQAFFPPPTLLIVTVFLVLKNGVKCSKNHRTKKLLDHFFDFFYAGNFFQKSCFLLRYAGNFIFLKNCDKTFFKKKKLDILKMSKKKKLKILLLQNFAKTPKYPLFTIKFSEMLYFFYKIVYFKGVHFFKKITLKYPIWVTYVFPIIFQKGI